jgi:hypothetical protein
MDGAATRRTLTKTKQKAVENQENKQRNNDLNPKALIPYFSSLSQRKKK